LIKVRWSPFYFTIIINNHLTSFFGLSIIKVVSRLSPSTQVGGFLVTILKAKPLGKRGVPDMPFWFACPAGQKLWLQKLVAKNFPRSQIRKAGVDGAKRYFRPGYPWPKSKGGQPLPFELSTVEYFP
jgi:hypothetical protein